MNAKRPQLKRNCRGGIDLHTTIPPEMVDDYENLIKSGYRPQEIVKEGIRTARMML